MTVILMRNTVSLFVALVAIKGIASLNITGRVKFKEMLKINIFAWSKIAGILWLALAELLILQTWAESMTLYKAAKAGIASGITVLILWAWVFIMSIVVPKYAGLYKISWFLTSAVLMAVTSITVLTLL